MRLVFLLTYEHHQKSQQLGFGYGQLGAPISSLCRRRQR